jgi:hypothetical protein
MVDSPTPHWRNAPFFPPADVFRLPESEAFMLHSTCSATDFLHPQFARICAGLEIPVGYHRKLWEWVFVIHHAQRTGAVGPGKRALGFGVGTEKLPAIFAGMGARVTATDAPPEIGVAAGWLAGDQFASRRADLPRLGMSPERFAELVEFGQCDMNNIAPELTGYDFCWSACSLEHLGDLRKGIDFIINSVEKTLRVGGIACHTTEFNCSSNNQTIESGGTVIYRRQDMDALIAELQERGHKVLPLAVAQDRYVLDSFVDVPPYHLEGAHLKLELEGYVVTSVGIVVERGA